MEPRTYRMMSVATSAFAVAFEPTCGMLWLMLATTVLYAACRWRSVKMFHVALMSLVYNAVQSTAATSQVAISYTCFFVSLDVTMEAITVQESEANDNEQP